LAKLHLDSLLGKRSPKAVRIALDKLPTGTDAYDSAYNSAMERIEGQMAEQTELAKQALAFLTCIREPLSTLQLREAMGVEVGELELDPDNYPDIEDILASCLGLVTIDDGGHIIRLVHYTTQEYLERTLDRWYPGAEAMIADVCISYLCLNRYSNPVQLNPTWDSAWYAYAAKNWGHHARRAPSSLERVVDFLTQEVPLRKGLIYHDERIVTYVYKNLSENNEPWTTGLHLAAECDLENAIVALLQRGFDLGRRDIFGRTPLLVAAETGSKAAVEQLLKHGSSMEERTDKRHDRSGGCTALHLAAENGHVAIVRLLLDTGAAINAQDSDRNTPISSAVGLGQTKVVQVLLDAGADKTFHDTGSRDSTTLMSIAVLHKNIDMVKLLLAAGVDVNERDKRSHATALWYAAYFQSVDCVRVLLEAGADPNLPGGTSQDSPLMVVCSRYTKRSITVAKMLLDAGANVDYVDSNGLTAYEIAKRKQNHHVAEYLLENGANPELGLNGRPDSPYSQSDTSASDEY
jgi:ankyrin repeat protein